MLPQAGTVTEAGRSLDFWVWDLLLHLGLCPQEVLVAAHVQLQAEVARGGERTQLALEGLSPVLVLMDLPEKRNSERPTARGREMPRRASTLATTSVLRDEGLAQETK